MCRRRDGVGSVQFDSDSLQTEIHPNSYPYMLRWDESETPQKRWTRLPVQLEEPDLKEVITIDGDNGNSGNAGKSDQGSGQGRGSRESTTISATPHLTGHIRIPYFEQLKMIPCLLAIISTTIVV